MGSFRAAIMDPLKPLPLRGAGAECSELRLVFLLEKPSTQLRHRVRKADTQVLSLPALGEIHSSPSQVNSAPLRFLEVLLRLLLSAAICEAVLGRIRDGLKIEECRFDRQVHENWRPFGAADNLVPINIE